MHWTPAFAGVTTLYRFITIDFRMETKWVRGAAASTVPDLLIDLAIEVGLQ
jgi:hypothetical protein